MAKQALVQLVLTGQQQVITGLNAITGSLQTLAVSQRDAAAQLNAAFAQTAARVRTNVNDINANVFKFRDSVGSAFNGAVNSIARVFRELARIRTGFFILVTFLGVRPAFRFFKGLVDESSVAANAFKRVTDTFTQIKFQLANEFIPGISASIEKVIKKIGDFFNALANSDSEIRAIIAILGGVALTVRDIGEGISAAFEGVKSVFKLLTNNDLTGLGEGAIKLKVGLNFLFETGKSGLKQIQDLVTTGGKNSDKIFETLNTDLEAYRQNALKAIDELKNLPTGSDIVVTAVTFDKDAEFKEKLERVTQGVLGFFNTVSLSIKNATDESSKSFTTFKQAVDGFVTGFNGQTKDLVEAAKDFGAKFQNALKSGLSDTFLQIIELRFNKFKDVIVGVLNSLKRAIADFLADLFVQNIVKQGIGLIAGGITSLVTPGVSTTTPVTSSNLGAGGTSATPFGSFQSLTAPSTVSSFANTQRGGGGPINFNVQTIDAQSFATFLKKEKGTIKSILNNAVGGEDSLTRYNFGKAT